MEEKRLEYLMMLQIYQSDTRIALNDAVIDRFATTAARRISCFCFNRNMYMYQCTLYSTIESFLIYRHFKYITH